MSDLVLRVAAKALVVNSEGKVLILREANTYAEGTQTGKYGLPGGRLEQGESYEEGFVREVKEETGLDVELGRPVFVGEWRPVIKGIPHQIIAIFCVGKTTADQVTISNEHDDYAWVDRDSYQDFNYMNPDPEVLQAYFDSLN